MKRGRWSGNVGRHGVSDTRRKPSDTDLTDPQWERLDRLLPRPTSGGRNGGRPAADRRPVVDAISYHRRSGAAWRLLPHDFPPWQAVYGYFRRWRDDGTWERVHAELRRECRVEAGLPPTPSTARVDRQTVKTTRRGGDRGWDGGKKDRRPQCLGHPRSWPSTRSGGCGPCG